MILSYANFSLSTVFSIALGGALGAISRYAIACWFMGKGDAIFPYATLAANAIGAFCIGLIYVLLQEKWVMAESLRPLLMTGFLGALTTFSTFSLETLLLLEQAEYAVAILYAISSVLVCLMLCWLGASLARVF